MKQRLKRTRAGKGKYGKGKFGDGGGDSWGKGFGKGKFGEGDEGGAFPEGFAKPKQYYCFISKYIAISTTTDFLLHAFPTHIFALDR